MPRSWDRLSDAYRNRLARRGVTREYYESGGNVTFARGHGRTPERPSRVERNPEAYGYTYPEYVRARAAQFPNALRIANRRRVYDHAKAIFSEGVMSDLIMRVDLHSIWEMTGRVSDATLNEMLNMDLAAWQEQASIQPVHNIITYAPDRDWFVAIRGYWHNPFWYH